MTNKVEVLNYSSIGRLKESGLGADHNGENLPMWSLRANTDFIAHSNFIPNRNAVHNLHDTMI